MKYITVVLIITQISFSAAACFSSTPNRSDAVRRMSQRRRKQNKHTASSYVSNEDNKSKSTTKLVSKRTGKIRNRLRPGDLFSFEFTLPKIGNSNKFSRPFPSVYTNDPLTVQAWIQHFIYQDSSCYFVGFDTESIPNAPWIKSKLAPGPATIQLSTSKSSIVIHLSYCPEIPSALRDLMYDKNIIKVGVGIDEDMLELYRTFGDRLQGRCRFDIAGIGSEEGRMIGLKSLLMNIVGVELKKPKRVTTSNWSSLPLSEQQLHYSARDAWAAVAIMDKLRQRRADVFGSKGSIFSLLRSERSLHDIDKRARMRKEAKNVWKSQLYKIRKKQKENSTLDEELLKDHEDLKTLLRLLRPDGMIIIDPIELKPLEKST